MGPPPAYIFVVRHGNRLDAADKQWHLSSPTPYDPPLTYGGWMHSRTVGARIAAILRDDANADAAPEPAPTRRRFRVVVHSSPFLRCVQTSIAISAGLASDPAPVPATHGLASHRSRTLRLAQASSFSNPAPTKSRPDVAIPAVPDTDADADTDTNSAASTAARGHWGDRIEKPVLRLDAFLGEWLSPDYFEHITPPPDSALMLATAKAELLRRSSYHDYPHFHHRVHASASSHLWGNLSGHSHSGDLGTPPAHDAHSTSALDTLSRLADGLPAQEARPAGRADLTGARGPPHDHARPGGYVFPVPSYALSTSEPIPRGYVAHARDACVSVDYQWDSSRECLAWGDGGTLPEEWASMHQRFRRGLRRLVDWYSSTENAGRMVTRMARTGRQPEPDCAAGGDPGNGADGDDHGDYHGDQVENVVVLVSHGAGCNALIGAITQQPVLADVAMSSLTMAKRRDDFDRQNVGLARQASHSSLDTANLVSRATMPEMYDLKLFANTDHLVAPPTTTALSRTVSLSRPTSRPRPRAGYASALDGINSGALYGNWSGVGGDASANSSLGSMRRSPGGPALALRPSIYNANTAGATVGSATSGFSVTRPDRSGSGTWGLWSPRQDDDEPDDEPEAPMFLNFSHERPGKRKEVDAATGESGEPAGAADTLLDRNRPSDAHEQGLASDHGHDEEHDMFDEDAVPHLWAGTGNGGLWGAPRPPGEAERIRDFSASKRRWTVTER